VPAAILGKPMCAFTFFSLTVAVLSFSMRQSACGQPAMFGTIGLSPKATSADIKCDMTRTANNSNQQHEIQPCNTPEPAVK